MAFTSLYYVYDYGLAATIKQTTFVYRQILWSYMRGVPEYLSGFFVWKNMPSITSLCITKTCNRHLMHWCVCMVVDWPVWEEMKSTVIWLWDPFTWSIHIRGTVWSIFDRNSVSVPHHMVYALLFARSILTRQNLIWGREKAFASSLDLPNWICYQYLVSGTFQLFTHHVWAVSDISASLTGKAALLWICLALS